MGLNVSKGDMYSFVTHTWNTVKGKCPHGCEYCYMKRWGEQPPVRFDESELKTDLGDGNFIFVGSSCDMWADDIRDEWIYRTLDHCKASRNRFLFQSKNPERFCNTVGESTALWLRENAVLGTTIETNRIYPQMGDTPSPHDRANAMFKLFCSNLKTMVTIEPIMDFDLGVLVSLVSACNPEWVNIGANTNHKIKLSEPPKDKIKALIEELSKFTKVKVKKNLKRILQ